MISKSTLYLEIYDTKILYRDNKLITINYYWKKTYINDVLICYYIFVSENGKKKYEKGWHLEKELINLHHTVFVYQHLLFIASKNI